MWMAVLPGLRAQELSAKVTVLANRIPSSVDHKVFQTLQSALYNFLNNRKWTNDTYQVSTASLSVPAANGVLANDTDIEAGVLTVASYTQPAHVLTVRTRS